jgi:Zn-dependent protease
LSDANPGTIFISLVVLAFSLSFHEMAHAWTALRLGDHTAYDEGRVSMNPAVHVDPIGTILLPLLSVILTLSGVSAPLIGWAKPVPISIRRLARPRRDVILIALAGPVSNVVLAVVTAMVIRLFLPSINQMSVGVGEPLRLILGSALITNLALFLFNLVPIPPLDGGRILSNLLPLRPGLAFDGVVGVYGGIILMMLVFSGVLNRVLSPGTFTLAQLLLS